MKEEQDIIWRRGRGGSVEEKGKREGCKPEFDWLTYDDPLSVPPPLKKNQPK